MNQLKLCPFHWDAVPFSFRLNWVFDPDFGWLEFYWFDEALEPHL